MSFKNKTHINFANLVVMKMTFPHNFVINQRPTMSFLPVLHITDYYYDQANKLVLVFASKRDLKLSNAGMTCPNEADDAKQYEY